MNESYTLAQLAGEVNAWCDRHEVAPASGQAGERLTERNVRYYRTLGLVDAPLTGGGSGYVEKHRLQLIALRLLQAQGLPLNRVRDLLLGRSLEDLRQIETRGLAEMRDTRPTTFRPMASEGWRMTPIDDEFLLVSRQGRGLSEKILQRLREVLRPESRPGRSRASRAASRE